MRRIDYDTEQCHDYARGRALTEQQLQAWISAFGALLPERRPLAGLDVGSGTSRFTTPRAGASIIRRATAPGSDGGGRGRGWDRRGVRKISRLRRACAGSPWLGCR
jgi:hypothetical protein